MHNLVNLTITKWKDIDIEEVLTELENARIHIFEKNIKIERIGDVPVIGEQAVYCHRSKFSTGKKTDSDIMVYEKLENIAAIANDVCFLSKSALKTLFVKYPYQAKYVFCEMNASPYWTMALPGLIRRFRINPYIKYKGIAKTYSEGKNFGGRYWLILKNESPAHPTIFSLNEQIGITGLINFLNSSDVDYVILRHFEQFPKLHRVGGDVDILVQDADWVKVQTFLSNNPGEMEIDLYGVTTLTMPTRTPYYIPHLARQILANKVIGPINAFVPSKRDYLNSYVYHCLYHKGLLAGIPSKLAKLPPTSKPENDYFGNIKRLMAENGENVELVLESLDQYMKEQGWRPHLDTLALLSITNEWLGEILSAHKEVEEIGLNVCVIKKGLSDKTNIEAVREELYKRGVVILKEEALDETNIETVKNHLRGGNWNKELGDDYSPSVVMIILDVDPAVIMRNNKEAHVNRIRHIKSKLRKRFDTSAGSYIHITDDTSQALEYLNVLYPDEVEDIINLADKTIKEISLTDKSWKRKLTLVQSKLFFKREKFIVLLKQRILSVLNK